jgi:hypothetical protein
MSRRADRKLVDFVQQLGADARPVGRRPSRIARTISEWSRSSAAVRRRCAAAPPDSAENGATGAASASAMAKTGATETTRVLVGPSASATRFGQFIETGGQAARPKRSMPKGVGETRCEVRSNSVRPSCASVRARCWLTALGETPSSLAAFCNDPPRSVGLHRPQPVQVYLIEGWHEVFLNGSLMNLNCRVTRKRGLCPHWRYGYVKVSLIAVLSSLKSEAAGAGALSAMGARSAIPPNTRRHERTRVGRPAVPAVTCYRAAAVGVGRIDGILPPPLAPPLKGEGDSPTLPPSSPPP